MKTQEAILAASLNKHFRTIIADMEKMDDSEIMDFSIGNEVFYVYRHCGLWMTGKHRKKKAENILAKGLSVKIM